MVPLVALYIGLICRSCFGEASRIIVEHFLFPGLYRCIGSDTYSNSCDLSCVYYSHVYSGTFEKTDVDHLFAVIHLADRFDLPSVCLEASKIIVKDCTTSDSDRKRQSGSDGKNDEKSHPDDEISYAGCKFDVLEELITLPDCIRKKKWFDKVKEEVEKVCVCLCMRITNTCHFDLKFYKI